LFVVDLIMAAASREWGGVEFWIFVLIAEYAATIRTVPPGELSRKRAEGVSR
jgi:hypothetical protein